MPRSATRLVTVAQPCATPALHCWVHESKSVHAGGGAATIGGGAAGGGGGGAAQAERRSAVASHGVEPYVFRITGRFHETMAS
jgi:hypothetical protein